MRKPLNKLLRPLGYRLEKLSRFRRELENLQARGHVKFIQIGAHDGIRFDSLYNTVTNGDFSGIVIEPQPDVYERLKTNYSDYPRIVPINAAIHERGGSMPLYRVSPAAFGRYPGWVSGIASFNRDHLLQHEIAPADIAQQEVRCEKLMDLLRRTDMLDAQLVQIDTEGYDAKIVSMFDFTVCRPHLIKFEYKNLPAQEHRDVLSLLNGNGYATVAEAGDTVAWRRE
jgi:FkbM family methyltransferase